MTWMVIRVRGTIHARHDLIQTLEHLHLTRPNHATLLPERPELRGMLNKVQGYVTWGEAEPETVALLIKERGITPEGRRLSEPAEAGTKVPDIAEITANVTAHGLLKAPGVRPLFRLKAPKGGWRSTKRPYGRGGALGYRGAAINELARRMM
jgi:large subunit ribosomal protein L30